MEKTSSSSSSSSSSRTSGSESEANSQSSSGGTATTSSSSYGNGPAMMLPFLNFLQSPIPAILEFSGLLAPSNSGHHYPEQAGLVNASTSSASSGNGEDVSIQIISSAGDDDDDGDYSDGDNDSETDSVPFVMSSSSGNVDAEAGNMLEEASSSSSHHQQQHQHQRHDLQQLARWLEHVLPFSLLLLLVFIRQHFQGFFLTVWVAAVLFKCNIILQKQTALKGERKIYVLVSISIVSILHVSGVYCWYQNDDLLYPLVLLPPKEVPPFWHAIFIIMVNDTMIRQVAMIFKCLLLMYYKNGRGHNFRRQGQMLTLVEYAILFYRTLLPTPVWYRFFLGNDYGSLFSSLTTGLYLTFKLTFVVEKVQTFYAAIKALSEKEVHYGSHATSEQVNAMGDLCAICQEKMHAPLLLRCKHIFCEDCVSEWLERERTCPLCRAVVKPTDLQSFGDGSTSLFYQLF